MHSCGINEEHYKLYRFEMPPKGFPLALFDMHITENIGFEKFDILSQNQVIKKCSEIQTLSKKMKQSVMKFLSTGKTIGFLYRKSCHAWIIATA
jgi:DNA polymerase-3 subunit alpha/error-prone DNA polymerase